jgi:hypothetical protein
MGQTPLIAGTKVCCRRMGQTLIGGAGALLTAGRRFGSDPGSG